MLYLCATPIGNLEDVTLRLLRILKEVSLIICEDTRHSKILLAHYDIHKPLLAYHDHNKEEMESHIIDHLRNIGDVALLTDAGMPSISDPGYELVNACRREGLPYTVLPGPSASLTALVLSGMASDRFVFEGFLPRKGKGREERLTALAKEVRSVILYEAPHRLKNTLKDLAALDQNREIACCRELTKRYEETIRGSLAEVQHYFDKEEPRGEFVLILEGTTVEKQNISFEEVLAYAQELVAGGMKTKAAAKHTANSFSEYRSRDIYQGLLDDEKRKTTQ